MRKIFVSNLVSLDGYFEGPGRELDWFVVDDKFNKYVKGIFRNVDAILLGRITYELFADFWPSKTVKDDPAADEMNNIPKIVFSKTLQEAPWGKWDSARLIKENIAGEVNKLKQQPGKDIVIFGSGSIVTELTRLKLVDEYRVLVNPVILGAGNSMFQGLKDRLNLELLKTEKHDSGVVILTYQLK